MANSVISTILATLFLVLASPVHGADEKEIYAGIEIGSTGVKAVVLKMWVDVRLDQNNGEVRESNYKILDRPLSKTSNTGLMVLDADGEFKDVAIDDTAAAVSDFFDIARAQFRVSPDHIFIVGSSGVAEIASKKKKSEKKLRAAVRKATDKAMDFVPISKETDFLIRGLVDEQDFATSCLFDVGGGNIKTGYRVPNGPNVLGSTCIVRSKIPGTTKFASRISEEQKKRGVQGNVALDRLTEELRRDEIINPLKAESERRTRLVNAEKYYLTGGIVWAMTTLLYPDQVPVPKMDPDPQKDAYPKEKYTRLELGDIKIFRDRLGDGKNFPEARWERVKDPVLKQEAEAEVRRVRDVFTPEKLIAGAEILQGIFIACKLDGKVDNQAKQLWFAREGQFAWILAYVIEQRIKEEESKRKNMVQAVPQILNPK